MIIKVNSEQDFANHLGMIDLHHNISPGGWQSKPSHDGKVLIDIADDFIEKLKSIDVDAADSVINFK